MTTTTHTHQAQMRFLREVLKTTYSSKADPKVLYPLLLSKLDQLDESLAQLLPNWARQKFAEVKPDTARTLAETLFSFSELLERFPQGSKLSNLAIAIAGYQAALQFFSDKHYPQQFSKTQAALATAKQLRQQILALDKKKPSLTPQGWSNSSGKRHHTVYLSERVETRSNFLMSVAGYFLLVFAVIEYLDILVTLGKTYPIWELETIGRVVAGAWVPLCGMILVFFRREGYVARVEMYLLRLLSWVSLLLGLFYLWMLVLGVGHTWHIYEANGAVPSTQIYQATGQQLTEKSEQLLPHSLNNLPSNPQNMLKISLKWNLWAMLASSLFIVIWRLTRWARKFK